MGDENQPPLARPGICSLGSTSVYQHAGVRGCCHNYEDYTPKHHATGHELAEGKHLNQTIGREFCGD